MSDCSSSQSLSMERMNPIGSSFSPIDGRCYKKLRPPRPLLMGLLTQKQNSEWMQFQMQRKRKPSFTEDTNCKRIKVAIPQPAIYQKKLQIARPISAKMLSNCLSRDGLENFRKMSFSSFVSSSSETTKSLQLTIRNSLRKHGLCVINGFLGEGLGENISQEVKFLHSSRVCLKGRLMGSRITPKRVRQDLVTWVNGNESEFFNLSTLCSRLDEIVGTGGGVTENYNICGSTKAMVARYAGKGARYQLHVDNPAKDGRCLTCIYYLNKNWNKDTMGGSLRLYAKTSGKVADIQPVFDRVVFFYSDSRNPHEVLPAYENRYAVTLWYFDHNERMEAIKRMSSKSK